MAMVAWSGDSWSLIALVGGFVVLAWWSTRPRYAISIVVDASGVKRHRGLSQAQQRTVTEFLQDDVHVEGTVRIRAARDAAGKLRLDVRGPVDQGTRQQIRNFLLTVL